ncbi:hypothetical protein B0T24DRAFT_587335 [Lasiosphaeria ovina]|uniref:Uncharacterized protein n=1 Tax=Lasiosphaeria ovina TaxID=92902 RepID=A0AAE0NJJ7_9PEZI|nr:hypothetical protein B0T24DRAFT_587335 [Lasiosphaeria ovina]
MATGATISHYNRHASFYQRATPPTVQGILDNIFKNFTTAVTSQAKDATGAGPAGKKAAGTSNTVPQYWYEFVGETDWQLVTCKRSVKEVEIKADKNESKDIDAPNNWSVYFIMAPKDGDPRSAKHEKSQVTVTLKTDEEGEDDGRMARITFKMVTSEAAKLAAVKVYSALIKGTVPFGDMLVALWSRDHQGWIQDTFDLFCGHGGAEPDAQPSPLATRTFIADPGTADAVRDALRKRWQTPAVARPPQEAFVTDRKAIVVTTDEIVYKFERYGGSIVSNGSYVAEKDLPALT